MERRKLLKGSGRAVSSHAQRVRRFRKEESEKERRRNLLRKESGSNGAWSRSADTPGKRNGGKREPKLNDTAG